MPWLPVLHGPDEDLAFFGDQIRSSLGWGVECGGGLAGFALAHDGWLDHLYIAPEWRGQGAGSALLAEALASSDGALQLWAFARNEPAIAFYAAHGFAVVEQTDGSGNEEREPDVRMSRGVRVRVAEPRDAAGVARVHVAAWQRGYADLMPASVLDRLDVQEGRGRWEQRLADPAAGVLVAIEAGIVVGFVHHGPARDDDLVREQQRWWEIYAVYVLPEAWGRGVGSRLWRGVVGAVPADAAAVCAWVLEGNDRARAAYASWGLAADGATRASERDGFRLPTFRCSAWLAAFTES